MDRDRLQQIISELDESVPKEGAKVSFSEYADDGPHAGVWGNERGYLRLGIEFLKAAFAPRPADRADRPHVIEMDLDYLIPKYSDIRLGLFERSEDEPVTEATQSWRDSILPIGCLLSLAAAFVLMLVGLSTILKRIFS